MGYTGAEAAAAAAAGAAAKSTAQAQAEAMMNAGLQYARGVSQAFQGVADGVVASWALKEAQATEARAQARMAQAAARDLAWKIAPGEEGTEIQPLLAAQSRGLRRAQQIWPIFRFQLPGLSTAQISDRAVVFGVFSGAYLHGYSYLTELSYETLVEMVRTYDQALSEMSAEEERAILDAAGKRYAEEQKLAEKDMQIYNKSLKVQQKTNDVDVRVTAIQTDIEALKAKGAELGVVRAKAELHIKDLENKLLEEELTLALTEQEVTRQELAAEKANLDVLETGIRALEIQAQIADAAYRLATTSVRSSELDSDIGRINLDIAETEAKKTMLGAEIARIDLEKSEVAVRRADLNADIGRMELDIAEVDVRKTMLDSDTGRINLEISEVPVKIASLENDIARMDFDIAEVDVKKTMLESDIGRIDYDIEETGVRKAGLEADIGRIEFDAEEVSVRIAQTEADTARIQAQAATEELTESELEVAKAETEAFISETELARQKEGLIDQRIEAAEEEISTTIPRLAEAITQEKEADLASQEARNQHTVSEYNNREASFDARKETSIEIRDLEIANHSAEKAMIDTNANNRAILHSAQVNRVKNRNLGAEEAAKVMATAAIVNTLTHQIMPSGGQ